MISLRRFILITGICLPGAVVYGQCADFSANASVTSSILCHGGTGTVTITASGGTMPLFYTFNGITNTTGVFEEVLAATNIPWSVTDANNCGPVTGNLIVLEPPALTPGTINTKTSQFCLGGREPIGGNPPTYNLASGGSGSFIYSWQIDEGCDDSWVDIPGTTGLTSYTPDAPVIPGLTCYRRKVTDVNNCEAYTTSKRFEVFPDLVSQNISPDPSNLTVCAGSLISATFTGGSGGFPGSYTDIYEYSINGGTAWNPYISGEQISTTGLSGVNIFRVRTRRMSTGVDGCNYGAWVMEGWNVNPVPGTSAIYHR
jgi:hypothetical protein